MRRFANQLATTLHIHDLRNPLLDTVSRITREQRNASTGIGAHTPRAVVESSVQPERSPESRAAFGEEAEQVRSSLEMTQALLEATGRVVSDARDAANASAAVRRTSRRRTARRLEPQSIASSPPRNASARARGDRRAGQEHAPDHGLHHAIICADRRSNQSAACAQ